MDFDNIINVTMTHYDQIDDFLVKKGSLPMYVVFAKPSMTF